MTLKIEKYADRYGTTIRLIGRMQAEDLPGVQEQIEDSESRVELDLEELDLVDIETVRFLGLCETRGITLLKCSAYIRDWISKERN